MLGELIEYAKTYGIADVPGFKSKRAKWLIVISKSGKLIDVIEDNKKYNMCPNLEQFELVRGETKSHFLLDSLGVVAKYDPKKNDDIKHEYYKKLLKEAAQYEPILKSCLDFLSDDIEITKLHKILIANKAKRNDNATFRVEDTNVVDTIGWHNWWVQYRETINGERESIAEMVSFASGTLTEPITNHFKISGLHVVGGQSSGSALISFDKDAFTSYNLSQSLNAACSEEVAAIYRNALDDLIEKAPRPIGDCLFLHWYKEPIPPEDDIFELNEEFDSSLDTRLENAADKVKRIFNAVITGERPDLTQNKYYILQVSGAGGRIMVRDWLTGDFTELVTNINQWFEDLTIIDPYGKALSNDFKLSAAMLRLISYRKNESANDSFKRIKKELTPIESQLWRSIIQNRPLPDTVASKALKFITSKLMNSEDSSENLDRIACALLKAYILRIYRAKGEKEPMKAELDYESTSVEYQAGRLLAVLASIQQSALGDVNAGLVQRYYTAASSTPNLVIGRLIQMSQHHLNKLEKSEKGLAIWYEELLASIMSRINIDDIPKVLSLEGQTLFALGYYQQKAARYQGKKTNKEEGGTESDN